MNRIEENLEESLVEPLDMDTPPEESGTSISSEVIGKIRRRKKLTKNLLWGFYALMCLIVFTLFKLPSGKLSDTIASSLASALNQQGIFISAKESTLSFFLWPSFTLKDVTLSSNSTNPSGLPAVGHLDRIKISPSLSSLLPGRYAGSLLLENDKGSLQGSFSIGRSNLSLNLKSKNLDLQKLGVFPLFLGGAQASAILDADIDLKGDLNNPSSLEGDVDLSLKKILFPQQSLMGFSIPKIAISEAVLQVLLHSEKATFKTFKLGKPGSTEEDLAGTVAGDIKLGKQWDTSPLNLKAHFTVSQNILKAFILLDALLGSGKQTDGSYSFNLGGTVGAPNPTPVTP